MSQNEGGNKVNEQANARNGDRVSYDTEYEQCFESWRLLVGLRPVMFVLSFSVVSAVVYFFFGKDGDNSEPAIKCILSLVGFVFTIGIIMFEGRTRQLYDVCIHRAGKLELGDQSPPTADCCHVNEGARLATLLMAERRLPWAWHTGGIYLTYGVMVVVWLFLLFSSALEIWGAVIARIFLVCGRF